MEVGAGRGWQPGPGNGSMIAWKRGYRRHAVACD